MALFSIADAWTPDIWLRGMREKPATFPSFLNSGAVIRNAEFDAIAAGPGITVNVPFFKDSSDQVDAPQVENTAPTYQKGSTDKQIGVPLNREWATQSTALSAAISGADPVGDATDQMALGKLKRKSTTATALLRGAFAATEAVNTAAPLSNMRLEAFDESGLDATSDQTFSPNLFVAGKALMGELADDLSRGCLVVHPNVLASLELSDLNSFHTIVASELPFTIRTYRGIPIFLSAALSRAGTTNGYVYDSYLIAPGVIAMGEKPQAAGSPSSPVIDVASLNLNIDVKLNNFTIIDRTRTIFHLNLMKWIGTPAGQSPTNAELSTATNWNYLGTTQNRAGVVCIRTNA